MFSMFNGIGLSLIALLFFDTALAATRADLAVEILSTPDPAPLYSLITSTVTVKNFGPARARRVKLTLQLPASTELQSNPDGCKFNTERDRLKSILTCRIKRLDPDHSATWEVLVSVNQLNNLVFTAKVSASNRDNKRANNYTNQMVVVTATKENEGYDACGCPAGTLWHPEMNQCMAIGLCDLPQYKGQCQSGDQCIACSENGEPQRPWPGGECPQPCLKDCD